jgi:hypothetical protein
MIAWHAEKKVGLEKKPALSGLGGVLCCMLGSTTTRSTVTAQ